MLGIGYFRSGAWDCAYQIAVGISSERLYQSDRSPWTPKDSENQSSRIDIFMLHEEDTLDTDTVAFDGLMGGGKK